MIVYITTSTSNVILSVSSKVTMLPLLPTSLPAPLSAFGISQAFQIPSSWYCYQWGLQHHYLLIPLVEHRDIRLITHQHLMGLDLEVPQDLCSVVLNHLKRSCPLLSWNLQFILATYIYIYCARHLVVKLQLYHTCLLLLLLCAAMISASVPSLSPAFSSHCYVFSISATSSICLWYILCRGLSPHDGLSSSSSSVGFSEEVTGTLTTELSS